MSDISPVVIQLLKGPVYRDTHETVWEPLLRTRTQVADYVAVIGLRVEIDETDGYAYLRGRPGDEPSTDGVTDDEAGPTPRLVTRHKLPYHVSLLLAILRKRLAEFDGNSTEGQLVVTTEQITELMRLYLPDATNETKLDRDIELTIKRVKDLGFVRQLRGTADQFEVRRIIRAFIDGQFLSDLDSALDHYLDMLRQAGERS